MSRKSLISQASRKAFIELKKQAHAAWGFYRASRLERGLPVDRPDPSAEANIKGYMKAFEQLWHAKNYDIANSAYQVIAAYADGQDAMLKDLAEFVRVPFGLEPAPISRDGVG